FLVGKLGLKKPRCAELIYAPPAAAEKARATEIRGAVLEIFGEAIKQSGEDLFYFVKALSDPGFAPSRNVSAKAGRDELDLSQGWNIGAGRDLAAEADRFRSWMRDSMQTDLRPVGASKQIRVVLDSVLVSGVESYRIQISPEEIAVTGHDRAGVVQALFRLQ